MKPLVVELFCGAFGWSAGWLELGGRAIGFDIEHRSYHGPVPQGAELVLQDVRTLHGSQFKDADLLLCSPPCTEYSFMAMPWSRGKRIAAALRGHGDFPEGYKGSQTIAELNALFDACFRIQREACEAAGRYIPMVVENVKGAQPWVGKARARFGSFYLWGDVDSIGGRIVRRGDIRWGAPSVKAAACGVKLGGFSWSDYGKPDYVARGFNVTAEQRLRDGSKNDGGSWFNVAHNTESGLGNNPDGRKVQDRDGNGYGGGFGWDGSEMRQGNSKSPKRKQASAKIAMIPPPLSRHIACIFKPI